MLDRIQAQPLLCQFGQERCCMVGLIVAQQHVPKMSLQVLVRDLLVTVDRRGSFVGAYPREVDGVHKVIA